VPLSTPSNPPQRQPAVGSIPPIPATGRLPWSQQKWQAYLTAIGELAAAQIAMALGNIEVLGVHPLAFLTQWGQQLQAKADQAIETANGAQTTADEAQNTANGIASEWDQYLTGLGLPAGDVAALVTYIRNSVTLSQQSSDNWTALLTGLAQDDAAAVATAINNIKTSADASAANFQTLFDTLEQATAAQLAAYLQTARQNADSSLQQLADLLNGMGLPNIAALVESLESTSSTATAARNLADQLQTDAEQRDQAQATLLNSWWTIATTPGQTIPAAISAAEQAWQTYQATNADINLAESVTFSQLIATFTGVNVNTGGIDLVGVNGLQDALTQMSAAISGDVTNAGPYAPIASIVAAFHDLIANAHTTSVNNANILAQRNNRPAIQGPDNTTEANINWTDASDQLALDAPISLIAFIRVEREDTKNSAEFTGQSATSTIPTGLNVNVWKVDYDAGEMTYITSTHFTQAQLNFLTEEWFFADTAAANVAAGDTLAVEFQNLDPSAVFEIYGSTKISTKPLHPLANLKAMTATRNAGTTTPAPGDTVALSSLTYTNAKIPYVGLTTSSPPPPVYPDYTTPFTASGTLTLQDWVAHADLIGVGQGGGGQGETGSTVGRGGSPGVWAAKTLTVGVDIPAGATITVTVQPDPSIVGDPGSGGAFFSDGHDGAATTFAWTDMNGDPQTFTCPGGLGGGLHNGSNLTEWGQSPGDYTYNDVTYPGGAAQLVPGNGNAPGGSGPGGEPFSYGHNAGRGQGWIVERQS
jgi:hypothetical protein